MASSIIGSVAGIIGAAYGAAADPVGRSSSLPASLALSPDERRRRDELQDRQSRQQRRAAAAAAQRPVAGVPVIGVPADDVPAPTLPPPQQAEPMSMPPRVSLRAQLDQCVVALQNYEFRIAVLEAAATTQHQRLLQCEAELQLYRARSPDEMQREPGTQSDPDPAPASSGNCDCISRLVERAFLSREDRRAAEAARRRV